MDSFERREYGAAIFIPLAERGGTIHTLGAWVLERACQTAATWRGREAETLTVSVNVSTMQIDDRFQGILAGGVETETQFQMLSDLGCPQVQGYLLARPMQAIQAQVALRKSWGNLPKTAHRSSGAGARMQAS